jgi:hypothetical protein
MTTRRVFSAGEIAKILSSQAGADLELDLGNGLKAIRSAMKDRPRFMMERDGKASGFGLNHYLEDADAAELAELSGILWEKVSPQFLDSLEILDEKLTPDALLEKSEDVLDPMTPDSLKEDEDLAEGLDALVPDALREKKGPAEPTLEDLLTPDRLRTEK